MRKIPRSGAVVSYLNVSYLNGSYSGEEGEEEGNTQYLADLPIKSVAKLLVLSNFLTIPLVNKFILGNSNIAVMEHDIAVIGPVKVRLSQNGYGSLVSTKISLEIIQNPPYTKWS